MRQTIEHSPHDVREVGGTLEESRMLEGLSGRFGDALEKLKGFPERIQKYARAGLVAAGVVASATQYSEAHAGVDTEPVGPSVSAEQTFDLETSLRPAERLAEQQEYIGALQFALGSTESNNLATNIDKALGELEQIDIGNVFEEARTRGASPESSISPFTDPKHEKINQAKKLIGALRSIPENMQGDNRDAIAALPSADEISNTYGEINRAHAQARRAASSEQVVADEVAKLGGLMQSWDGHAEQPITPDGVELGVSGPTVGETHNLDGMTPEEVEAEVNRLIEQASLAREVGKDLSGFAEGTLEAQSPRASSESGLEDPAAEIAEAPQVETAEVPIHKTAERAERLAFSEFLRDLKDRLETGDISPKDALDELDNRYQEAEKVFRRSLDRRDVHGLELPVAEKERLDEFEVIRYHRDSLRRTIYEKYKGG
jgi:hypothetical protein